MRTRLLPDAEILKKQLEADHQLSLTALGRQYGVSRQAVLKALRKAHAEPNRPGPHSLKEYVPWRVKVAHEQDFLVRMLRLYAREQKGLPLPREREKKYREWRETMDLLDLVVTYSPEVGFSTDERQPGDGKYWRP